MKIHHIGVVTADLERTAQAYAEVGLVPQAVVFDPVQKVNLQMLTGTGETGIELISPASEDSPVMRALQKGGGLNHLCYETAELDAFVEKALAGGALLVCAPTPAVLFGGRRVAFLFHREIGLTEYLEAEA